MKWCRINIKADSDSWGHETWLPLELIITCKLQPPPARTPSLGIFLVQTKNTSIFYLAEKPPQSIRVLVEKMKFLSSLVVALAALPAVLAMNQKMPAIVYFREDSTPDSVIEKAKKTLIEAGGKITHTYAIIKWVSQARLLDFN